MKTNESGRSMIEMLGVLAIIGVLSVGGIAGYSKAMSKYRFNKTIDQVTMLVTNLRTLYAQQTNYDGLNNQIAVDMGAVPEEMLLANSSSSTVGTDIVTTDFKEIRNAFQGKVYVGPGKARSDDNANNKGNGALVVLFTGLTKEACAAIVTSDWGSGTSSGYIGIVAAPGEMQANASTGTPTDEDGVYIGADSDNLNLHAEHGVAGLAGVGPLSVAAAASGCKCSGPTCSVMWKYY